MSKIVVILVLFSFIGSRSFTVVSAVKAARACEISKKTSSSSKFDSTLLYEEKEKEEENSSDTSSTTFVAYFIHEIILHPREEAVPFLSYRAPRSCGDATDIPVFLAKRAILI